MRFEGHYFDGQSALRHEVAVTLGTESLQIHGREGGLLALWPYAGLRLLEEVYGGQSARIVRRGQSAAILVMAEPRFLAALEQRSGRRLGGARALSPGWKLAAGALLALLAVGAGLLWGLPHLIDPLAGLVPQAWERALGEKVVRQIAPPALVCKAPAGAAALQRLVDRLLAGAPEPVSIRVRVARRPTVNAFAAPGGEIVVLQGLLD
ncbi:MAG: hypothetical protein V3S29_01200, partial [bacterium]